MPSFTYDPRTRRYRSVETGQFVTPKQVRGAVDQVIDGSQADIVQLATRLQAGELSLAEWQLQTAQAIKALHVATAAAANGGFNNMTKSDWGFVGSLVKKQYAYLRDFADDIATGKQLVAGNGFLARARLYAQAARGSYESMKTRAAKFGGVTQAKRILGISDSCPGCLEQAAKGWQPIEEVAPIGSQQCLTNCRCTVEFSTNKEF
jgi:hypothetical protein